MTEGAEEGDEFGTHVLAAQQNIGAFTAIRDLADRLIQLLTVKSVGTLDERERELVETRSSTIRQDLDGHLQFVTATIPEQVGAICRLPRRDDPAFLQSTEAATLYFQQAALLCEILGASARLDAELRRHGFPSLFDPIVD